MTEQHDTSIIYCTVCTQGWSIFQNLKLQCVVVAKCPKTLN